MRGEGEIAGVRVRIQDSGFRIQTTRRTEVRIIALSLGGCLKTRYF
jgi:hypothetical protein